MKSAHLVLCTKFMKILDFVQMITRILVENLVNTAILSAKIMCLLLC